MTIAVTLLALVSFCLSASAQAPLAEQLLAARDAQEIGHILAASPDQVDQVLFDKLRSTAQSQLDRREHATALRQFDAALAVAKHLNSASDTAFSHLGMGTAQLRMGRLSAALGSFDAGYDAALESGDRLLLANLLRSRGVCYNSLGRLTEGIADTGRSLALYRELKDLRGASFALNNIYAAHMVLGDLRQAAAECEEAYRLSRGIPEAASVGIGNLGPILAQQGNYTAAKDYLEESIRLNEEQRDLQHLAGALHNIGPVYRHLNENDKALAAYSRAIAVSRESHDSASEAFALFNRAAMYQSLSELPKALADLQEGLKLQEQSESSYETVFGLTMLSEQESSNGQLEQGCDHAQRALDIARRFRSRELLWRAFSAQGDCEMGRQNLPQAKAAFQEGIRQVESMREAAGGGDQEAQSFLNEKIEIYHNLIRVLLELNDPKGALTVAESARARQLVDTSLRGKTTAAFSMTPLEVNEEKRLSDEVTQLARRVASTPPASRAEVEKNFERARSDFESFRGHLYAAHPQLAASRGEASPFRLEEAAALLPDSKTLLVEFVTLGKSLVIFTIERGADGEPALQVHTTAWPRPALAAAVGALREQLGSRDLGYRKAARSLYTQLLGPIEREMRGKESLVLLPDGALWDLPFQALVQPGGVHLMERHVIFYAPSLTFLRESRRHSGSPARRGLLAIGNPASAQLPAAAREVQALAALYSGDAKILTGKEATKQAWMSNAPDYRVLHIASHGNLNAANPMYSWLALAPGSDPGDGALEARDILPMSLHADLAILSACSTARGGVLNGEGVVGMSWAFLAAGARATLVSQWEVDSAGTSALMQAFHKSLRGSLSAADRAGRARSLQQAMLAVSRMPQYSHPFYWASFVMIGDGY